MSRFFATVAAAIAVALLPLSPAGAQSAQQTCAADIQTFCAGAPQGEGRVARCLRANPQKLSPSCQSGMGAMVDLMKEVVAAREDDVHPYCAGAAPGTTKECLRVGERAIAIENDAAGRGW